MKPRPDRRRRLPPWLVAALALVAGSGALARGQEGSEPAAPAAPTRLALEMARPADESGDAATQQQPGVRSEGRGKRLRALRIDQPPRLDGNLDDGIWQTATFVDDFQQKGAKRGFPPHERTEVAFVYDDEALYVGARVHLKDPTTLRAARSQRDDPANSDRLVVSLDTLRNRQTAYNFGVTAGGARLDYYQPADDFQNRDFSYDPVWQARTAVGEGGWSAEMRIPFSSLRFHGGRETQTWGLNIQRVSPAVRLYAFWVVVPAEEAGWASRFGELEGIEGVRPGSRFAVTPYVAGQSVRSDLASADDPFDRYDDAEWRYGGDFQLDLSPTLSLEATFNPDFGQIEADPAIVNLTAYEVFFPEKRPFFLEGAQLLQGAGPRYYYSRRIGAAPHGTVGGVESDLPATTTIAGAAKIIGRLRGGQSLGALVALTDRERARGFDPETGLGDPVTVEPQTFFGVSRWQKDLGAGSTFGFVTTGVRRDLGVEGGLDSVLAREAYAGGLDWNLRFAGQSHEFGGFVGGSTVRGEPAAILRLQGSSARYYQRPDADHVELDPTRTELSGYTAGLRLGRIQGAWRWALAGEARSPGFEINDAGAMATADDIGGFAQLSYGTPISGGPWQRIDASLSLSSGWNFGGTRQYATPEVQVDAVWRNFWRTWVRVAHDLASLSDSLTRGGPLMETAATWRSRFGVSSNDALPRVWSLEGAYASDELDGWAWSVRTRGLLRLRNHLTFSIAPGYERARDARQYFATLDDGRPETFGRRYVFAELERSTVSAQLRAGLSIVPGLGLDLYFEPFVATGSYSRFGELTAPRAQDLRVYGVEEDTTFTPLEDGSYQVTDGDRTFTLGNGDFDFTSFRSNAVLRWDYAQGSSLYLVWAQNRLAERPFADPADAGDLLDVFDAPVEDVFAIKLSVRVGPR
jgi:hypothetical protein